MSLNVVNNDGTLTMVADNSGIWKGTSAEWTQYEIDHPTEASAVKIKMITDDETGATVDAVTDGDMRAVTSNAVYDALSEFNNVKSMTITGTTNDGGGIMIPSALLGHKILMAYRTDPGQDNVCLLTGNNYIVVKNVSDMSAMVQVTMSIKIWYVE